MECKVFLWMTFLLTLTPPAHWVQEWEQEEWKYLSLGETQAWRCDYFSPDTCPLLPFPHQILPSLVPSFSWHSQKMRLIHSYQYALIQIFWMLNRSIPYPQSLWPHTLATLSPKCVYSNRPLDWKYTSWKTWWVHRSYCSHSDTMRRGHWCIGVLICLVSPPGIAKSKSHREGFGLFQMSRNVALTVAKKVVLPPVREGQKWKMRLCCCYGPKRNAVWCIDHRCWT